MQEIKKRRIVLASLLKPIDDARMYEKLGITLTSRYEVYIIGQAGKSASAISNLHFIQLPAHARLSYRRLFAPWHVLRAVSRIRPHLLIVCTAELLPVALCARFLWGVKIIYDIQENYVRNILHGNAWPRHLRPLLALTVRIIEYVTSLTVSHFLLAEQTYADELKFIRKDFTIVENKLVRTGHTFDVPSRRKGTSPLQRKQLRLLFSGTLAETTGVFTAISLARRLYQDGANIQLSIVGYAAQEGVRADIKKLTRDCSFIELAGIDSLVPHSTILEAIAQADFGIVAYPKNISTWESYPTKLYEYMGYRLPILLIDNPRWISYCAPYRAAVVFSADNRSIDTPALLAEMRQGTFYVDPPQNVFWESEAPKLLAAVSNALLRP